MLFSDIVYGPIHSRRLGTSLGVNLMPTDGKLCTFNCVYCECGWNQPISHPHLPTRQQVRDALEKALQQSVSIDVITFSGNGEPTLHPDILYIMRDTFDLRNKYAPNARIAVLSNSTQIFRPEVREALVLVDDRILKLDSAIESTFQLIDQPVNADLRVEQIVAYLKSFHGDFILQTCFLKGEYNGQQIDNTTPEELEAWYQVVRDLSPKQVMMYVIDRQTPCTTLEKISRDQMFKIAEPLQKEGFTISISA